MAKLFNRGGSQTYLNSFQYKGAKWCYGSTENPCLMFFSKWLSLLLKQIANLIAKCISVGCRPVTGVCLEGLNDFFSKNTDRYDEWINLNHPINVWNHHTHFFPLHNFNLARLYAIFLASHYWDLFSACLNVIQNEIINVILDLESLTFPIRIMCLLSNDTDSIDLPLSNHDKLPQ